MTGLTRALVMALALTSLVPTTAIAHEMYATPTCLDGRITLIGTDDDETALICRGVAAAADILMRCGISAVPSITVETAAQLVEADGFARRGEFLPASNKMRLYSFARFIAATPPALAGIPVSYAALYASLAAHEMAHAIIASAAPHLDLVPTAHEFIAYAVQVATLPPPFREQVRSQIQPRDRHDLLTFSPFLLYADPERFAVTAWRHFSAPQNGCRIIRDTLKGAVHFPPPGD